MKAIPYFERCAARRIAARPAGTLPVARSGISFRAALRAEALALRASVRLQGRAAPGVDPRTLRRSLAWPVRLKPRAAAPAASATTPGEVIRHTERVHMFTLSRIERVVQQLTSVRLPELVLLRPPAVLARTGAAAPAAAPAVRYLAAPAPAILHTTEIRSGELRQIWLRPAAASLPLVAPAAAATVPVAAAPLAARRGESATPQWLTPRLQRISHQHFTVLGRGSGGQAPVLAGAVAAQPDRASIPAPGGSHSNMRFAPPAAQPAAAPAAMPAAAVAASTQPPAQQYAPAAAAAGSHPPTAVPLQADVASTARRHAFGQAGMPPVRLDYRRAVLPARPGAMAYAPRNLPQASAPAPARVAPSLIARAAHAPASAPAPGAGIRSTAGSFPPASLPWQASAAPAAAAAVGRANAAADGVAGGTAAGMVASAPALALRSANPFVTPASAPAAMPPRAAASPAEQEWVQAVQRVIFTRHVLDKVADDVVAKIEKRVRIERERRGL